MRAFRGMRSWRLAALLLTATGVSPLHGADVVTAAPEEWHAIATFNFPNFVEWPRNSRLGEQNDLPITFCVVEAPAVQRLLREKFDAKRVKGREVRTLAVSAGGNIDGCDVIYIGPLATSAVRQLILRARELPILLIGSSPEYFELGAHVVYFLEQQNYRFDVNREAAEASQLQISSRALALARRAPGRGGKS